MQKQRYEGRTAAEAAIRACEALGVTRSELRHQVVSDEGELLSRRVVIEVEVSASAAANAASPAGRSAGRDERGNATDSFAAPAGEDGRPPRRRGRPARAAEAESGVEAVHGGYSERSSRPERAERQDRPERRDRHAFHGVQDGAERAERPRRQERAPRQEQPDSGAYPHVAFGQDAAQQAEEDGLAGGGSAARPARGERRERSPRNGRGRNVRGSADREQHAAGVRDVEREQYLTPPVVPAAANADDAGAVDPREAETEQLGRSRRGRRGRPGPRQAQGRHDGQNADFAAPAADVDERQPRYGENNAGHADSSRRPGPSGRGPVKPREGREGIDALLAMQADNNAVPAPMPKLPAIAPTSERSRRVVAIVTDLVRLMGFDLETRLVNENEAEIHVHLYGPAEKRAIGDKGEVLLSLQFAVNRILSRHEDDGEQVLVLDAGGYRQRRQLAIEDLARDLAQRAMAHQKAVRLSPMSAHDRRIVHMALRDVDGIATQSEGDGVFRNLLIVPSAFL